MMKYANEKREALRISFAEQFPEKKDKQPCWIQDFSDEDAIVEKDGRMFKVPYTMNENGSVKFAEKSEWERVHPDTDYVSVGKAKKDDSEDDSGEDTAKEMYEEA